MRRPTLTAALAAAALLAACASAAPAARPQVSRMRLGSTAPQQLVVADDGALWMTDEFHGLVRRAPDGKIARYGLGGDGAADVAIGPDGRPWFAAYDRVGRVDAAGGVRSWAADSANAIAASGDALWFTAEGAPGRIAHLTTAGAIRSFAVSAPRRLFAMPGIAAGPDGAAWFTQAGYDAQAHDAIGRMTTGGRTMSWPLRLRRAAPTRIAAGPDGALWFTERNAHAIGRITTAGHITEFPLRTGLSPYGIVPGSDGALWFTADGCIGRITTAGRITAWPVHGAGRLLGIAAAPDGSFWAADDITDSVWHFTPPADGASATCSPPAVTRRSGSTQATLVYRRQASYGHDDSFTDPRLRISRGGRQVFAGTVPPSSRGPEFGVQGDTAAFAVRDLDGDGEPEVVLDLNWGGAHCCSWSRVYRFSAARRTYVATEHFWGNGGYSARDLNGDGAPELLSQDDRFAYDFDGYAGSVRPIRILRYDHGTFRDVTRRFPNQIRRDAADIWHLYLQYRAKPDTSVRGILPAWAADEYMLGRGATVWPALEQARRAGYLDKRPCDRYDPCGAPYVKAVRALLRKLGYIRR